MVRVLTRAQDPTLIKRTIEISKEPAHLTVRLQQLVLERGEQIVGQAPCEDVGVVLVDHPQCTYSHAALAALVVCGRNHLPVAVLLPLANHSEVVWRLHDQLSASKPLRKQLWKQLIQAKVRAQAANLPEGSPPRSKLLDLARRLRSGDPTNVEAQAARIYWQHFVPEGGFQRDAEGEGLNSLLNYGYAVLRAALARAIVAAGLQPALGLHHCNRANHFCLADDLIEPLRPLLDLRARQIFAAGHAELTSAAKGELLKLLAEDVVFAGETGPLMVNLHRYVASLAKCFRGESCKLEIPTVCPS